MKRPFLVALTIVAAAAAATVQFAGPATAQAQKDWTQTVVATPEGGFRMGNPAASVKLVEYGSLTCPHCAHFAKEGTPALMPAIRSGRLSFEFRNFVRDPLDLTGALLSHCVAPARYFGLTDRIFATQEQWIGRFTSLTEEQQKEIGALPQQERLVRFASVSGLGTIAAEGGVPAAKTNACINDAAALKKIVELRRVAMEDLKVESTPSFLLNGKLLDNVHDWSALQPHLGPKG